MAISECQVARIAMIAGREIQNSVPSRYIHSKVTVVNRILPLVDQDPGVGGVADFAKLSERDVIGILPDAGAVHVAVHGHAPNPAAFVARTSINLRVLHVRSDGTEVRVLRSNQQLRIEAV